MLYEKKKILIYRIVLGVVTLFSIILGVWISNIPAEECEMTESACYIDEYYEYSNKTKCELDLSFNCKCYGSISVNFYDKNEIFLSSETGVFYCDDNNTDTITFFVNGKVEIYDIVSCDAYTNTVDYAPLGDLILFFAIIPFSFFIASLFLSCRKYECNCGDIVVYAGWFHHYIKINGKKFDEHNTIKTFTAIPLSCTLDDGTDINVVITLTNRIALKINNRLYTGAPPKTKKKELNKQESF